MVLTSSSGVYLRRVIGAAALDAATFEEVEADGLATGQAFATVILASLAGGIGSLGFGGSLTTVVFMASMGVLTWGIWALIMFEIGVRLMPGAETRSSVGELLRTIGFSAAPGGMLLLGLAPSLTIPVFAITGVWLLAAMTLAVRQALDLDSTARALAICATGWALVVGIVVVLGLVFGPVLGNYLLD